MRRIKNLMGFPQMAAIIPKTPHPEGDGVWIEHYEVTAETVKWTRIRGAATGEYDGLEPGTYVVLSEDKGHGVKVWMSDTWTERHSQGPALRAARGDVLLVGLGLGMLAIACARKSEVASVTVLEINPQVIRLVEPHLRRAQGGAKLRVLQADAHHPPLRGRRFSYIYHDLWESVCTDDIAEMNVLCRQYRRFLQPDGKVDAWQLDHLRALKRAGRWR